MRGVRRWIAAVFLTVAQYSQPDLAAADILSGDRDGSTILYFTGGDLWRDGYSFYGGLLWSPASLDDEGFTLKLFSAAGIYHYRSGGLGGIQVTGRQLSSVIAPSWRFKRYGFTVTAFAGLDAEDYRLFPNDPGSRLRGAKLGIRGGFDLWYQPTPATMLAADASISSIGDSYSARLAYGWHVFNQFYLGPEALAFMCEDYRQVRLGLHMTGLKTDGFEWSASLGSSRDSDHRTGVYARIGLTVRQ
jgi:hypothetical protein